MKIDCPTCGTLVSADQHRGILINRKLSLASDIILWTASLQRFNSKQDGALLLNLQAKIQRAREELAELMGHPPPPDRQRIEIPQYEVPTPSKRPPMETPEEISEIEFSDFTKVALKVGLILAAERVPKSDKLLQLTVDIGESTPRTILAGIGKTYEPEQLVGVRSVFVTNLKPRKMMGRESHGMALATGASPESLSLVSPSGLCTPGARVG